MNSLEENKMDNTNQPKLLDRINALTLDDQKIVFTNINTVVFKESNGHRSKERTFTDYIHTLRKEIKDKYGAVKYDKQANKFFYININYNAFEFDIPKVDMINYAMGKYNKITSTLNDLYLESMSVEEKEKIKKEKRIEEKRIVDKAEGTNEELTPIEARIYLDYLKDLKRTNAKTIEKKSIKSALTTLPPILTGTGLYQLIINPSDDIIVKCFGGVLGVVMALVVILIENGIGVFDDYITKEEIEKYNEENKLIKTKIKGLSQIENIDKIVPAKAYSTEEIDEQLESLNLKNASLKYLDDLVNRINVLNAKDKILFLNEAQNILSNYTEEYTSITNRNPDAINIELGDYMDLKMETYKKIAELELKVNEARQKDIKLNPVTDESRLLSDKIDGLTQLGMIDPDIQKVHDNTMQKVKVKKLKENKRHIV